MFESKNFSFPSSLQIMFPILFPLLLFLILLSRIIFRIAKTRSKLLLSPPSPPMLPIIGNLHQLGPSPHCDLQRLAQKHGPLMLIHLGQSPILVVSSAEAAREIMRTHDLVFCSRPSSEFAKRLLYNKDIAFMPYGEHWTQMRRVATLQLLSTTKVQSYRPIREEETSLMIDKIHQMCSSSSSSSSSTSTSTASKQAATMNFNETLMSLTNDIVCRVALGAKYSQKEVGRGFREMVRDFVHLLGIFNVGEFVPCLSWVNYLNGMNSTVEKTFRELDLFLEKVIQDHVDRNKRDDDARSCGDHDQGEEDFVDILLRIQNDGSLGVPFSRDTIKAIILDMFAAGTATTFTIIEWTMSELIRHPQIMKEVQEEIREVTRSKPSVTEDLLHEIHYLQMVIKETLRLHPPIPLLVPRESIQDVKVQGYDILANTRVIVNAWAIGRDPESYEKPEVFQPKRFMDGSSNIDYKGNHFELIPFGAGRRICPGIVFAMVSVELALANLLYHFDWELPDGEGGKDLDMTETSGITVHRKNHLILVAKPHLQ